MTATKKIKIFKWLKDFINGGGYNEESFYCFTYEQFDLIDCVLSDRGIEYSYSEFEYKGELISIKIDLK